VAAQPAYVLQQRGPDLLIRIIWLVFIGWWLGGIVSAIAWILFITIIGLPLGLYIVNRLPGVITLRPQQQQLGVRDGIVFPGPGAVAVWGQRTSAA
jgi:uncharacterized membrane protein YccF (DUF307 family)